MNVLDLFCGCGGMSWGLHQTGFTILCGIDNDAIALKTFKRNHPDAIALHDNLALLSPEACLSKMNLLPDKIDCIIGGPPCQGFSKNVPRSQRFLDDNRNLLVRRFLEFVKVIRPTLVLMENVAEIVNAFDGAFTNEILSELRILGYDCDVKILDAVDYGIPQHRKRAFFFGSLSKKVEFPYPTHFPNDKILPLFVNNTMNYISVWDAIGDLPSLTDKEGTDSYNQQPVTPYQKQMRQNIHRLHNHVARPLTPKQLERLSSLAPGEGAKMLPEQLRPKSYYSGAYGRLTKDMVARTLTRWLFHPGSGRYGHPVDIRTITIREAARLQSFSDDFIFEGSFTQASSQIGNSVPPLFMRAFAPIMQNHLKNIMLNVGQ
ncbi:MAG: DNA cytosine methyltransferase [bacterium]|nr:DNA cytosine methyltransferase [bacterium]